MAIRYDKEKWRKRVFPDIRRKNKRLTWIQGHKNSLSVKLVLIRINGGGGGGGDERAIWGWKIRLMCPFEEGFPSLPVIHVHNDEHNVRCFSVLTYDQ